MHYTFIIFFVFYFIFAEILNAQAASCPNGTIQDPYDQFCYKFVNQQKIQYEAEEFCEVNPDNPSGHLVSIKNSFENQFITILIRNHTNSTQPVWSGGYSKEEEAGPCSRGCNIDCSCTYDWQWQDCATFKYINFAGHQDTTAAADLAFAINPKDGKWLIFDAYSGNFTFLCKMCKNECPICYA